MMCQSLFKLERSIVCSGNSMGSLVEQCSCVMLYISQLITPDHNEMIRRFPYAEYFLSASIHPHRFRDTHLFQSRGKNRVTEQIQNRLSEREDALLGWS